MFDVYSKWSRRGRVRDFLKIMKCVGCIFDFWIYNILLDVVGKVGSVSEVM